jgi:hypothetical protein
MKSFLLFLCSDGMNAFFIIGKALAVIISVSIVVATVLLIRSGLPNDLLRRYPWRVKLGWSLPFAKHWQKVVAIEDVQKIRKFQRRFHTWELVCLVSAIFRIVYFNILAPRLLLLLASGQCRN